MSAHDEPMTHRDARLWRSAAVLWLIFLAMLALPPAHPLDKADRYAYAVCHRLPEHSYFVAGRQLPLCARCSGTFLGTLAGLGVLLARGRGRAGRFPAPRFLPICAAFIAAWAVDGLNSYLAFFMDAAPLYEPHNLLRLITGTLEGLVIAVFLLPLFNMSVWAAARETPSLEEWRDLLWLLAAGAAVVGLVASGWPPLLYPLALLSGVGVVLLVGLVSGVFVLLILRREGQATAWHQVARPLAAGLILGVAGLHAIGLARDGLTVILGLPF
ncbi:MAG: DUF2085 domain-containing protein [Anaerolineae bacterium]|nr:DUF2085 domain-containing protein [Anaerolineae bacterium]